MWAELAGCGLAHPPLGTGSRGQIWKGAIVAPERHHLPNCKQTSLLTKTPCDSGWSTSPRKVIARDQLPRRDTLNTWEGAPIVHPENWAAGTGEVISHSFQLGVTARQAPDHLRCSGLGWPQNAGPTKSAPLWSTREPGTEWLRPGECIQPRDSIRQFLAEQKPRAWAVYTGKAHTPWEGAKPVWLNYYEHTPVIFVCSVPPSPHHDWTSEPKTSDHHCPACVRVEIRHWRDQQTEEAKINRGNFFGRDRFNRLKPCS